MHRRKLWLLAGVALAALGVAVVIQNYTRLGRYVYVLGGGEDLPQILAARRLAAGGQRVGLSAAAARGAVVFAVCAGYQIVGTEFGGAEGEPVPGLGLLDIRSGRG